jgi:AcrR family transcriptional regulator
MDMSKRESKTRLLEAALKVVTAKGYSAARVEDVCAEAGLTKGSFFHHFKGKDDLGLGAAAVGAERTRSVFASATSANWTVSAGVVTAAARRRRRGRQIQMLGKLVTGRLPQCGRNVMVRFRVRHLRVAVE